MDTADRAKPVISSSGVHSVISGNPGFEYKYPLSGIAQIDEKTLMETAERLVGDMSQLFE